MSEMLERVAKAIAAASLSPDELPVSDRLLQVAYVPLAKAAIGALREPTVAMIEAEPEGDGEWDKTNSAACAKAFWQAMIDEALKPVDVGGPGL